MNQINQQIGVTYVLALIVLVSCSNPASETKDNLPLEQPAKESFKREPRKWNPPRNKYNGKVKSVIYRQCEAYSPCLTKSIEKFHVSGQEIESKNWSYGSLEDGSTPYLKSTAIVDDMGNVLDTKITSHFRRTGKTLTNHVMYTYNSDGFQIEHIVKKNGALSKRIVRQLDELNYEVKVEVYNEFNELKSYKLEQDLDDGHVTKWYNQDHVLTDSTYYAHYAEDKKNNSKNPDIIVTRHVNGKIRSEENKALTFPTYTEWNEQGKMTLKREYNGEKLMKTHTWRYSSLGLIKTKTSTFIEGHNNPIKATSTYEYDIEGNWTKKVTEYSDKYPMVIDIRIFEYYE